jgi:hypothetical protein
MPAWSELSDPKSYRSSGSGLGRVLGLGFAVAQSGQRRRRRGGVRLGALGLWDELPSGPSV